MRNESDFRNVLAQIKKLSLFSGLQLNESKSNAMILSNTLAHPKTNGNIRCMDKIKILRIHLSNLYSAREIDDNWKGRMDKIEKNWAKRDLSIIGRNIILKNTDIKQNKLHYQ